MDSGSNDRRLRLREGPRRFPQDRSHSPERKEIGVG